MVLSGQAFCSKAILIDLYDAAIMDKHYYDKIKAIVGRDLSEINKRYDGRRYRVTGRVDKSRLDNLEIIELITGGV